MTREQKLALIVGFSLILLVGVLISDHLSRAREARVAAVRSDEIAVVEEAPAFRPDQMRINPRPELAMALPAPVIPAGPAEPLSDGVIPLGDREPEPASYATAAIISAPREVPIGEPGPFVSEPIEVIAQGRLANPRPEAASTSLADQPLIDQVVALGGRVANGELHLPAAAGTSRAGSGTNVPKVVSITPAAAQPLVSAGTKPDVKWHTVAKGESLFTISKMYYGDGKVWRKLAQHNASRVGEDGSVRIGVRLEIPPAEVIGVPQAAALAPSPAPTPVRQAEPTPAPRKEAKPASRPTYATYTVRKGDTLGEIAQRVLGTSKRKGEIVELNRDRIKDENSIRIGMVLKVPTDN